MLDLRPIQCVFLSTSPVFLDTQYQNKNQNISYSRTHFRIRKLNSKFDPNQNLDLNENQILIQNENQAKITFGIGIGIS